MKRLWILAFLPWLAHCSYRDAAQTAAQPYYVDPVTVDGAITEIPAGNATRLLLRQNLNLRICLRDAFSLSALATLPFAVGEPARPVTLDQAGCFLHPLEITYRPHAAEAFLPYSLLIRAQDGTDLSFTLNFWVNPWSRQVTDLLHGGKPAGAVEPESAESARLGTEAFSPALWFPDSTHTLFSNLDLSSFEIVPGLARATGGKTDLPLSLSLHLNVRAKKLDGTFRVQPLQRQSVKIHLALIHQKTRQVLGELAEDTLIEITAGDGSLALAPFALAHLPEPGTQLAWHLRLEPQDASAALLPWEGEVPVTTATYARSLRASAIELPTDGTKAPGTKLYAADPASRPHGFFLDRWKVQSGRNLSVADGNQATAGATFEVCLFDSVTAEALGEQRVRVEISETPEISEQAPLAVADVSGCVRPGKSFPVSFPYFSAETYLKRYLVVRAESGPHAGLVRSVEVAVNPWQKDDELFYWDVRRGPAPRLSDTRRASLQLQDFSYRYPPQKDDLEIDARLNLTYKEAFYVSFQPSVNRPAAFDKQRGPTRANETLWPGMKFKVRLLFAGTRLPDLNNVDRFAHLRLLSGYETTVSVDDHGMLTVPVALAYDFNERPLLETQTRMFMEISSDAPNGPEPITFEAPFDLMADNVHGTQITPLKESFDTVLSALLPRELGTRSLALTPAKLSALAVQPKEFRFWKPSEKTPKRPYDLFLEKVGQPRELKQVELNRDPWPPELRQAFTSADFTRLTSLDEGEGKAAGPEILRRLCAVYFNPVPGGLKRGETSQFAQCLLQPDHFLRLHRFSFVDGNVTNPLRLPGETTTLQMNAAFFREQSTGETEHDGHTGSNNIDLGVTAKVGYETFGNGVTAHASYLYKNAWFKTKEKNTSVANRNRLIIQEMRTLVSEETKVEALAPIRDCVFFRHRAWMPKRELTEAGRAERGYFFCRASRRKITESWFYVNESIPATTANRRDSKDLRNRVWLVLLRGEKELARFKALIENRNNEVDIAAAPVFKNGIDHLLNDVYQDLRQPYGAAGSGGAFPGLLDQSAW